MHIAHDAAPWRSFHHVAVVTPDLDATRAFYVGVLRMEAGPVMTRAGARHCFVKPGEGEAWGLHFFEDAGAQPITDRDELRRLLADPASVARSLPGALQHIAFGIAGERAALDLRERLRAHDVPMTGVFDIGAIRNFVFADNNGMLLEAAWPRAQ